jgi:tocopherol O-methyltransferase
MIVPRCAVGPAEVAGHYDDLDWAYREIWGEHLHHGLWVTGRETVGQAVRALADRVADAAAIGRGDSVCDVGCGYGATARHLRRTRGARVTGITLSALQHREAQRLGAGLDGVVVRLGDWLDNGLPSASFDSAIAIESTEHMADKERCFAEARRVLRPGGRFAVAAWLAADRPRRWEVRHLLEPICAEGRLPGLGSAADYRRLLETAGLALCEEQDLTPGVKRTWSICIRRTLVRAVRDHRLRAYLLAPAGRSRNRDFLPALFRIRLAYETGAMRYGLFAAVRR